MSGGGVSNAKNYVCFIFIRGPFPTKEQFQHTLKSVQIVHPTLAPTMLHENQSHQTPIRTMIFTASCLKKYIHLTRNERTS